MNAYHIKNIKTGIKTLLYKYNKKRRRISKADYDRLGALRNPKLFTITKHNIRYYYMIIN